MSLKTMKLGKVRAKEEINKEIAQDTLMTKILGKELLNKGIIDIQPNLKDLILLFKIINSRMVLI